MTDCSMSFQAGDPVKTRRRTFNTAALSLPTQDSRTERLPESREVGIEGYATHSGGVFTRSGESEGFLIMHERESKVNS